MSEVRYELLPDGKLAAWVSPAADRIFLRRLGEWLGTDFGAEAFERFDGGDQIFWDFLVAGDRVTLHWHERVGIALVSSDTSARSEELVRRIAPRLHAWVTWTAGAAR